MAKDPRFNFYPDNYEGGTKFFSLEEDGAYIRLLMLQFSQDTFTEKQAITLLMQRCPESPQDAKRLWAAIKHKFVTDGSVFWNVKLRTEMEKSLQYSEDQSKRAKIGWDKRKAGADASADASAYAGEMPGECPANASNSNSSFSSKNKTSSKKNGAEAREQPFDFFSIIPQGWDATHFEKLVNGWVAARRKKRNPPTEYAKELALTDLVRYFPEWDKAKERMEKAIKGGRLDLVFPEDKKQAEKVLTIHDADYWDKL